MTRPIATRTITDPHTGRIIHAPAHILAPPRTMAPVPMHEWLSRTEGKRNG